MVSLYVTCFTESSNFCNFISWGTLVWLPAVKLEPGQHAHSFSNGLVQKLHQKDPLNYLFVQLYGIRGEFLLLMKFKSVSYNAATLQKWIHHKHYLFSSTLNWDYLTCTIISPCVMLQSTHLLLNSLKRTVSLISHQLLWLESRYHCPWFMSSHLCVAAARQATEAAAEAYRNRGMRSLRRTIRSEASTGEPREWVCARAPICEPSRLLQHPSINRECSFAASAAHWHAHTAMQQHPRLR